MFKSLIRKLGNKLRALMPSMEAAMKNIRDGYSGLYLKLVESSNGPGYDDFDILPHAAQCLFVAATLDAEIQNGGICQYLANYGSECAVLVADSLRTIGLEPMAKLYEDFLCEQKIDPANLEDFQIESVDAFVALYKQYPASDSFDEKYMNLRRKLNFETVMRKYAEQNWK